VTIILDGAPYPMRSGNCEGPSDCCFGLGGLYPVGRALLRGTCTVVNILRVTHRRAACGYAACLPPSLWPLVTAADHPIALVLND